MEPFKICAAADLHLGMRFSAYPSVQKELITARFKALKTVIEKGNAEGCSLLVIAGDLFDRLNIPAKEVQETAGILSSFQGDCVVLLPGNHDYYAGPGAGVWDTIGKSGIDNLLVASEEKEYYLEPFHIPVVLYPGPCTSQHGKENALGWLRGVENMDDGLFHLGVAHGSIEGISPDLTKQYFPMNRKQLEALGPDLWIIGHTHIPFPETAAEGIDLIIPGTPEPDGFDSKHEGSAVIITISADKKISMERFKTGMYRFMRLIFDVESWEDIESAGEEISKLAGDTLLLQARLSGSLPKKDLPLLGPWASEQQKPFFYAEVDTDAVVPKITEEDIGKEFREGSFPSMLLSRLAEAGDIEALQTAYRMIEEMRQ